MNILILAFYRSELTPVAPFVFDQAKAYAQQGHSVRIVIPFPYGKTRFDGNTQRFPVEHLCVDGIDCYFFRFLSLSNFGERYGINTASAKMALSVWHQRILKGFSPDVIHVHTLGSASVCAEWFKRKIKCPMVVTTHGSDTSDPYSRGEKEWLRGCCDRADTVVGVSSKLVRELTECGTQTQLQCILNGFAVHNLTSEKKKQDSWIQVGNLIPQKYQEVTIRAFAAHLSTASHARLTIVGAGPERDRLEGLCKELGVSHAVRFTGQLPNRDVLAEMATSQFFVMPSHPEGFGVVYLEAMASGCITVGTAGEGIADLIVHGENGFLVPPDDATAIEKVITWCLQNPTEAEKIAEAGRQAALALTWTRNAKQYISLFKELLT